MDVTGRNSSTTHNSDVDKLATADTATRLPFSNSLASTIPTSKSRTVSSAASDTAPRTADTLVDSIRPETVTQNGGVQSDLSSTNHSAGRSYDPVGVPLLSSTSVSIAPPTATHVTSSVGLSQRDIENCVAQWTGESTQLVGAAGAPPAAPVVAPAPGAEMMAAAADDGWYYCDPQGQIQGQTSFMYTQGL